MPRRPNLEGQRFGQLVVQCWQPDAKRDGAWLCRCDCGNTHVATSNHLTSGRILSCGCLRPKHGGKGSRAYGIWQGMLARCTCESNRDWKDYGGRGIAVCERWRKFPDFLADMGEPPPAGTIERRDNSGNYEPGNCYWASRTVQARNTRRTILITYDGRTQSLAAWAEELDVSYWKLHSRYKLGWTSERIFEGLLR